MPKLFQIFNYYRRLINAELREELSNGNGAQKNRAEGRGLKFFDNSEHLGAATPQEHAAEGRG
jgi:hypothetical protein